MSPDDQKIDDLVTAVAEGRAVDWAGLLAASQDDTERRLIGQLKILAEIAGSAGDAAGEPALFRWGSLEVLQELGQGAFGHVYRARDPRLDREVALKLFHPASSGDDELVGEAQMLARIRHPHVVVVHGADVIDGRAGLWMELVRGRTLQDILRAQGPFSPREATLIGLDLCRALAAVHAARLVHRDIKTTNVMRETGGRIVLTDFGAGVHGREAIHTQTRATGTPFYMAPELFEGAGASPVTDLYALGVLLFHIISGADPVSGSSFAELRERHARRERTLLRDARPDVPASLAQVVDRALEHLPAARHRSAASMERALAATLDVERVPSTVDDTRSWRRWMKMRIPAVIVMAAVPILLIATLVTAGALKSQSEAQSRGIAFVVESPEGSNFAGGSGLLAVSPDGGRIAFATAAKQTTNGVPDRLWLRRLGSLAAEPIPGTEGGFRPFWSPDGRFLGFTAADGVLKRVDVAGGSVLTLAQWGMAGAWSSAGTIIFTARDGRLYRVSQDGGESTPLTTVDAARGETRHLWPSFLPDGRRFLFMAESATGDHAIYMSSLESPGRTFIANLRSKAEYAEGFLYYQRDGTLIAQPFQLETAQLVSEATRVASPVRFGGDGGAAFSVSNTGVVVYATEPGGTSSTSLTWFDADGKRLAAVGEQGAYAYPSLSPDGSRLAVFRLAGDRLWDIWTIDLVRNVSTRFTFEHQVDWLPIVWSADARNLYYSGASNEHGPVYYINRRSLTGASPNEKLLSASDYKHATAVSSDGRFMLLNRELGKGHGTDVWALPLTGEPREPFPVLEGSFDEESAAFSPDGRWIVYASNESGVFQIYAQPFPKGPKVQLSRDGGVWPIWNRDGRVFYATEDRIWVVAVKANGAALYAGVPTALFSHRFVGGRFGGFAVDAAGRRFLLVVPEDSEPATLKVIVNPAADLKLSR